MGFTDDLTSTLKKATSSASKKVEELTGVAKLNLDIYNVKSSLDDLYCDLGKAVYLASRSENGDDEIVKQMLEKIEAKIEELKLLEQKHSELKRIRICHICGHKNLDENMFCSMCGNKL